MTGRNGGRPSYCTFCAHGSHRLCAGDDVQPCACGTRNHDPDVETAAAMRLYQAPDLVNAKLPVETLATQWRRSTERVKS